MLLNVMISGMAQKNKGSNSGQRTNSINFSLEKRGYVGGLAIVCLVVVLWVMVVVVLLVLLVVLWLCTVCSR